MPVFRVVKNSNYTTMSNYHLRDKSLTLKAKGLQSMLLSLPETWQYSVRGLAEICLEGKSGVTAVLQELERAGYLVRKQSRLPDGRMGGTEYWIYEKPHPCPDLPCPEKPDTAEPATATPVTENRPQIITNKRKTEESNTEGDKKTPSRHQYGQYGNVILSDVDLTKLREEFPSDWKNRIERLSEYMASTGKNYKSHLATIRSWARRDAAERRQGYRHENYQYEEGESL